MPLAAVTTLTVTPVFSVYVLASACHALSASGSYQNDVLLAEVIGVIEEEFGYSEEVARCFHRDMIYFSYGLAILANTGHLHLTEPELRETFRREFRALIAYYGKPAKLPEFAVKAGIVL